MQEKELLIKKLKMLIKERFKQQKIFAEKLEVGETQVTNWVKGNVIPSVETLEKISEYCKIHISYFFSDETNANVVDEELFNKVFALAYDLASKHNITISGSYFLGCYDLVVTTMHKDNVDCITAFNNSTALILKLAKNNI